MGVHWKDCCWSYNFSTMTTWCKELTHLKRPWWWERLRAGGEGDDRGWDGWMASPTQWTWVWVDSGSWWWTGRPGMLRFMGSKKFGHNWATELNWKIYLLFCSWCTTLFCCLARKSHQTPVTPWQCCLVMTLFGQVPTDRCLGWSSVYSSRQCC